MVLRDAWLFGGTIRENITYGRENATWEEILAAAEAEHVEQGTHEGLLARAGPADT